MERAPELVVVGAGPHALTFLARLHRKAPSMAAGAVVLDPSGTWLARWNDAFDRLGITHLRSPCVHHPHPDAHALANRHDLRDGDLVGRSSRKPSQRAFSATCTEIIEELGACAQVWPVEVRSCRPLGTAACGVELGLGDGSSMRSRHVVLATNAARRVHLPGTAGTDRLPDVSDAVRGERIVVVGGGLTAAQLVERAAATGACVTMVARRPLVARDYDVDPGWMGPKCLAGFERTADREARVRAVAGARGGGTVPAEALERLRGLESSGTIRILEGTAAVEVRRVGDSTHLCLADGRELVADRVVAAMGSVAAVEYDPLLSPLVRLGALETVLGYPVLDDGLRVPGTDLYVMGRLAAERLGPAAGNLAGARRAAARIAASLMGLDPLQADPGFGPIGTGALPSGSAAAPAPRR